MHHRVSRQCGVVGFEIELEMILQTVFTQEIQACGGIRIILVFGGFFWFWLDEKLGFHAELFLVIDRHVEQLRQMVEFPFHVSVVKGGVTLASAPEDITIALELMGDFHRFF